jgi:hypothetical protein
MRRIRPVDRWFILVGIAIAALWVVLLTLLF